jgi:DNA-damage-inducible protein D
VKKELILELFRKFEEACYLYNQLECWSARDLQEVLGYTEWRNFLKILEKAKLACENTGVAVSDHFVEVNKMVQLGSGAERNVDDFALTRYACYLIAQNGDPVQNRDRICPNLFRRANPQAGDHRTTPAGCGPRLRA